MSLVTHTLTIAADTPDALRRADRAVQSLAGTSRRQTQALFDSDCVTVNGQISHEPWRPLAVDDAVTVAFDTERRYEATKRPPSYLGFDRCAQGADGPTHGRSRTARR